MGALVLIPPCLLYIADSLDPGLALHKDFGQEYLLARAFVDGVDPYVDIRDLAVRYLEPVGNMDKAFPTPHPPTVGLLLMPLALVDYVTAVRVWFAIQLIALVVGIGFTLQSAGFTSKRLLLLVCLCSLGSAPVVIDLSMGQLTLPLFALMAASLFALRSGHQRRSGALLAVALLLKPLAWPWLLFFLWKRYWSGLLSVMIVSAFAFALTAARFGLLVPIDYLTRVLPLVSTQYASETSNISLWTIGPRLFRGTTSGPLAGTPAVFDAPAIGQVAGALIPLVVLIAAAMWMLRTRPSAAVALGVLTGIAILVNPISWEYYLLLAIIPVAQLLARITQTRRPPAYWLLAALVIVCALYVSDQSWYKLASVFSAAGPHAASLASLLSLGPAYSVCALCVTLSLLAARRVA